MTGKEKTIEYQTVTVTLEIGKNTKAFLDAYAHLCRLNSAEDYLRDQLIQCLSRFFNDADERHTELDNVMKGWNLERGDYP